MVRSRFLLTILAVLIFLAPHASAVTLTILHSNDTHGHLLPFSYPQIVAAGSEVADLKVRADIGGIARRATLARGIREELTKKGTVVWLVDSGDVCDGTPFSTEYHGEADVVAMNAVGYDFGTLGNHEFNNSIAQVKKLISLAKFPILCANAVENATGKPVADSYEIREVGGVRIGLFGLTTHESSTYPAAKEGVSIGGEVETARKIVDELRPKADIIVLISHCGKAMDETIATAVEGIDVILGGHSHSRLPVGELIWRSDELKAREVNGTIIVQAFQWGGELGRLDLLIDKDEAGKWRIDRYHDQLIPVTAEIKPDSAVARVVDGYWKPIASRYAEVVGTATADFSDRGDDRAEYNLVADAVRETFGTDIEFENLGGVRAPIVQGPITRGDLTTVDPFSNTVVTFTMTGKQIREILLRRTPAVSGLRYRVVSGQLVEATIGGQPLQDDHTYTGASNSYFADHALEGFQCKDSGKQRLDVLIDYVKRKGTVSPAYDGRSVVMGGRDSY